jgi:hypothetical protein
MDHINQQVINNTEINTRQMIFQARKQFICSTESAIHVPITNSRATWRMYLHKQSCQLRISRAQENLFSQFYSFPCTRGHRR